MNSEDQVYFKRNEVLNRQVNRAYIRHIDGHGATLEGKSYPCSGIARPGVAVYWNGGYRGSLILAPKRGGGGSLPREIERPDGLYPESMSVDDVVSVELEK